MTKLEEFWFGNELANVSEGSGYGTRTTGIRGIIAEAREAGRIAAQRRLVELETKGPKYNVIDSRGSHLDGIGRQKPGWQMLDLCGSARIHMKNRRGKFWRELIKFEKDRDNRIFVAKGSPHGGWMSIHGMHRRQEVSIDKAAHEAAAAVFRKYGVDCWVSTYLD